MEVIPVHNSSLTPEEGNRSHSVNQLLAYAIQSGPMRSRAGAVQG